MLAKACFWDVNIKRRPRNLTSKEKTMERDKIESIIQDKNDKLERNALGRAGDIISTIAANQESIAALERANERLREELKSLKIQQLDTKVILGE